MLPRRPRPRLEPAGGQMALSRQMPWLPCSELSRVLASFPAPAPHSPWPSPSALRRSVLRLDPAGPAVPWALGPSTMLVHMMGTIQFLVAVGLRSLFSCWWLAGSGLGSQWPPSGPATWPSPLSGLLLVASCLLQGTHTTVASHSQAFSGPCPHSVWSWSQVSAQGTCGQAPQSTSLACWLFSDHFYV